MLKTTVTESGTHAEGQARAAVLQESFDGITKLVEKLNQSGDAAKEKKRELEAHLAEIEKIKSAIEGELSEADQNDEAPLLQKAGVKAPIRVLEDAVYETFGRLTSTQGEIAVLSKEAEAFREGAGAEVLGKIMSSAAELEESLKNLAAELIGNNEYDQDKLLKDSKLGAYDPDRIISDTLYGTQIQGDQPVVIADKGQWNGGLLWQIKNELKPKSDRASEQALLIEKTRGRRSEEYINAENSANNTATDLENALKNATDILRNIQRQRIILQGVNESAEAATPLSARLEQAASDRRQHLSSLEKAYDEAEEDLKTAKDQVAIYAKSISSTAYSIEVLNQIEGQAKDYIDKMQSVSSTLRNATDFLSNSPNYENSLQVMPDQLKYAASMAIDNIDPRYTISQKVRSNIEQALGRTSVIIETSKADLKNAVDFVNEQLNAVKQAIAHANEEETYQVLEHDRIEKMFNSTDRLGQFVTQLVYRNFIDTDELFAEVRKTLLDALEPAFYLKKILDAAEAAAAGADANKEDQTQLPTPVVPETEENI